MTPQTAANVRPQEVQKELCRLCHNYCDLLELVFIII